MVDVGLSRVDDDSGVEVTVVAGNKVFDCCHYCLLPSHRNCKRIGRVRVHHLAESGSKSAQAAERLHHHQDRFFAAVVLIQNVAVVVAAEMGALVGKELVGTTAGIIGAAVLVPIITALFGELVPKVLASQASERFALAVAMPPEALTRI